MDPITIYQMAFEVVIFAVAVFFGYLIYKKLPYDFWVKATQDESGKPSSTRIKSMVSTAIGLFLVMIGTFGIGEIDIQFVLLLLGYAGIETGAEKVKRVRMIRANGVEKK